MKPEYGMVHGRFQPFHNGHLEYLKLALDRCQSLLVGITNPDPFQTASEATSNHRHLEESNPYTYFERQVMIRDTLADEGVDPKRIIYIPFPVNMPDRWRYYLPTGVVHYMRVFSPWEQAKADRLRDAGYDVEILQPGAVKEVEATSVRQLMLRGEDWKALVPAAVAHYLETRAEG